MDGTIYDRRVVHRPEPRPVLSRAELAKKPALTKPHQSPSLLSSAPLTLETSVPKPSAKITSSEEFSKLTPIYATTPMGSASKIRAKRRGMDWIHSHSVKKKVVHHVVKPAIEKVQKIEAVEEAPKPAPALDFNALIAAELAQAETFNPFAVTAPSAHHEAAATKARVDDELQPIPGHSMSLSQRDVLHRQFQHALASDAKHTHHQAIRKHVTEQVKHHARKAKTPRGIAFIFLFGVILSGVYATIDSFSINAQARQALAEQATAAKEATVAQPDTTTDTTTDQAAAADAAQVPAGASTAPTTKTAANYSVAPDLAKFIKIPKLGINAPVVTVGLTKTGAIDTPTNIYEAAWYNGSSKPGADGATFIDGHSSASHGALFGNLGKLTNGDTIQIQKGDNSIITYKVVKVAIVDRNSVDMASILKTYGGAAKGLNLITCVGSWIQSEQTLTDRVLVWTVQV